MGLILFSSAVSDSICTFIYYPYQSVLAYTFNNSDLQTLVARYLCTLLSYVPSAQISQVLNLLKKKDPLPIYL